MQPISLLILLGCVAFANSFGINLNYLNPLRTSEESPVDRKLCNPIVTANSEGDSSQFLPYEQESSTTITPGDFSTRRLVPLPTLAPTSTSSTTQVSREIFDKNVPSSPVECEPAPIGIGTRLSSQLLKVLVILG
ncbi:uncharacterized protein LOC108137371 [Drosophila elegans]|uniref:uncharacterized protein LOC108137371 n=1 Tax=Drosophila elegans TaxID=30023 RepID=UPI0007E80407|nr:uncharacterized protein LOC108137371 [Drosophila elegans]